METIQDVDKRLQLHKVIKEKKTFKRIKKCLEIFSIEKKSIIVHVTGTNGKGSTVNYIKNILLKNNDSVTTFVSPYVIKLNERITYNDDYISDYDFVRIAKKILATLDFDLTYFEYLFLIYLLYTKEKQPKYMLVEVGIGGLMDVTNVLDTDLQLLTNASLDHTKLLGKTVAEILFQKLGIVKTKLITTDVHEEYIKNYCEQRNLKYQFVKNITKIHNQVFKYNNKEYFIPLRGDYQFKNAALAIEAIRYLDKNISDKVIQAGLADSYWPGRYDVIGNFTIDGAHNIDAIRNILANYPFRDSLIFTQMKDRIRDDISCEIAQAGFKNIYIYILDYQRAIKETDLTVYPFKYQVIKDINTLDSNHKYLCIGSLYLASELLNKLK